MGNSYGGRTAMWFTIFDDRIKACVASGCMNTFRERSLKLSSCGIQYPRGLLRYADVPDLFCLIAPRPLLVETGTQDELNGASGLDNVRSQMDIIHQAYTLFGAKDLLKHDIFEGEHRWNGIEAIPWMQRHLGVETNHSS